MAGTFKYLSWVHLAWKVGALFIHILEHSKISIPVVPFCNSLTVISKVINSLLILLSLLMFAHLFICSAVCYLEKNSLSLSPVLFFIEMIVLVTYFRISLEVQQKSLYYRKERGI